MCLEALKINTQGLGINPMREKRENGGGKKEKSKNELKKSRPSYL
jgi:hypothetical protein